MWEHLYDQSYDLLKASMTVYFQWYVFFWTLNLAALAWLHGKQNDLPEGVKHKRRLIAYFFVAINLVGTVSSIIVLFLAENLTQRVVAVGTKWMESKMPSDAEFLAPFVTNSALPEWILPYVCGANAFSTALVGVLWILLARSGNDSPLRGRHVGGQADVLLKPKS